MCFPHPPQPLLPPLPLPPVWPGLVALAVGALYCRVDLAKPGVRGTSIIIQPCVSACRRQLLVLAMPARSIATDERHNPQTVSQSSI